LPPIDSDVKTKSEAVVSGINSIEDSYQNSNIANENEQQLKHSAKNKQAIGFFQAVLLPGVIMYSLCYACVKMVNYSFMFWLPYYLTNKFHWEQNVADEISVWYDVGGIVG
jgi:sugar phosphate permease